MLIIFQKKQKKTCSSCRTFDQCEERSPAAGSYLSISVVFSKTQQCTRCVYPLFPTLYTLFSSFTLLYHFILGIFLLLLVLLVSLLSFALVTRRPYPGGGGVLPYMGHIGMCRCEGYGVQAVYSSIGYINQSVWV